MFYNAPLSMKDEMYHLYVCIFHMKYYTMYYYILRVLFYSFCVAGNGNMECILLAFWWPLSP